MRNKHHSIVLIGALVVGMLATGLSAAETNEELEEYLWMKVNIDDPAVALDGRWLEITDDESFGGLEATTTRSTAFAEFTFRGSGIRWIGSAGMNRGQADVYLNDELVAEAVCAYRPDSEHGVVLFEALDLEEGIHTLRVDPTGETHEDAILANLNIDAFAYIPTLEDAVIGAEELLGTLRFSPPANIGEHLGTYYPPEPRDELLAYIAQARDVLADEEAVLEDMYAEIITLHRSKENLQASSITSRIPDLSGNENHATVHGDPLWVPGRFGRAPLLDGHNDYFLVGPDETFHLSEAMTITAWIYVRDFNQSWQHIAGKGDRAYQIRRYSNTDQLRLAVRDDEGSEMVAVPSEKELDYGRWYFVAGTYDRDFITRIYINGELEGEGEGDQPIGIHPEAYFTIGINHDCSGGIEGTLRRPWDGVLDEISLWDRALSKEELRDLMIRGPLAGDEEGLVGYWNFETVVSD